VVVAPAIVVLPPVVPLVFDFAAPDFPAAVRVFFPPAAPGASIAGDLRAPPPVFELDACVFGPGACVFGPVACVFGAAAWALELVPAVAAATGAFCFGPADFRRASAFPVCGAATRRSVHAVARVSRVIDIANIANIAIVAIIAKSLAAGRHEPNVSEPNNGGTDGNDGTDGNGPDGQSWH
jgi:hypothetical protein